MPVSKWFAIAQEGATTDGRKIDGTMLEQMAKNFDPKTYGARVNLEHIRGLSPESVFRSYGDVAALKVEEVDGKLKLFAQVDGTDDLVELAKKRQKIYSSMEVDYDFSDTGEAYLVGLGMTDSPASLGTDILQFSSKAAQNPFAGRKLRPENAFSEAFEADLVFEEESAPPVNLIDTVKGLFSKHKKDQTADQKLFRSDLEKTLELIVSKVTEIKAVDSLAVNEAFTQLVAQTTKLQADFTALKEQLEEEPGNHFSRPPADGGTEILTDY